MIEPAVAGGERHDLRLADHGHGLKSKVSNVLPVGNCASEMPLDAAATTVGDLVFGECRQKAGGRPTLLVRTGGQIGPHQLHGGQAQLGEQQLDACSVGRVGLLHATPPSWTLVLDDMDSSELVVERERHQLDDDRDRAVSGLKRSRRTRSGNRPASNAASIAAPSSASQAALMRKCEQFDHDAGAAPRCLWPAAPQRPSVKVGGGKQLIAIDEIEQRHRLAAERMDDVPVVDDMAPLAAGLPRPRLTVMTGVEPRKHSSRSS